LLICGLPEVNVNDLKANCKFAHSYNFEHHIIKMFFRVLAGLTLEEKANFLIFLTGSSQEPIGDFAALAEMGRLVKIAAGGNPRRDKLPHAHACWNQLDLP
jgi:hypothetical protein